ncbi:MAG: hypothetical protein HOM14_05670 [Gammaproteobacteria bacterium]|nr:hypothetical protein [Gammaproteobacteria bacterium]MBT4195189.1 hypothetical protein [Gammaproteobacteria bacterium]MBT4449877.1 hypothetical protein [Gammaproteobacteria bacterium]MBT4863418.1 hypothetical protein [Gammaproteobacteria bacterium]MBT6550826.1 hypothetical protein [Gammaproteobacteria bacterium]
MSTKSLGSVLLYVLWILVVISILAFKLTSSSRVVTLNHSAVSTQLKNQMQISSATQFAIFKIISNQWKYKKYELNLNKQDISIQIYNEIGFISFYELRNRSLKNVFNLVNIDQSTVEKLENVVKSGNIQKYNTFNELLQFEGINVEVLNKLIPLISIFHEEPVNPLFSPENVLILLSGVDQYSVQKLIETADEIEREQLRKSVVDSLNSREFEYSDDIASFFRVHITIEKEIYLVFLKYDHQQKKYKIVLENKMMQEKV